MFADTADQFEQESKKRLIHAEQSGLRIAIACRTLITGVAFTWYVLAALLFPDVSARLATIGILLAFTAVGIAHLAVIGTQLDRRWIKYGVYMLDTLSICAIFAFVPISRAADIPQIIAFRSYGIYFLFPMLAVSCLSLSWRLVLWTGGLCIVGWWAAFAHVTAQMERTLSWADIPSSATRADYDAIFLSIDFIGRGNRIEETAMIFFATLALAVAVYRARRVFFEQVASDIEWRRERRTRERVSDLLAKYVPEEIARKLIADDAPLKPHRSQGTALVMDIAGFTQFSADQEPEVVIAILDAFLADATRAVTAEKGIVISYLGDGFLVTFNSPVAVADPANAAVHAATALLKVAEDYQFQIRIGIASGVLVSGIIGNDARQSFTVYGNAVNLAARLESLCKGMGQPVLMDAATQVHTNARTKAISHGAVDVRGFATPVAIFGLDAT